MSVWNYSFIPKLQPLHRWSLGWECYFIPQVSRGMFWGSLSSAIKEIILYRTDVIKLSPTFILFLVARAKQMKSSQLINSLWLCGAIWRHRSGSTLAQVITCCLTAPVSYLNQYPIREHSLWGVAYTTVDLFKLVQFHKCPWNQSAAYVRRLYILNFYHISQGPMS